MNKIFDIFKKNKIASLFSFLICAAMLNGCARNISSNTYSDSHVGESSETLSGRIISVRNVMVGPEELGNSQAGAALGGIAGGIAGYQFGGGRGQVATTGLGAIAGALAGAYAEKELKTQEGLEYIVELNNGEMRTVVQGNDVKFRPGQRVYLIVSTNGRSRIIANNSDR